MAIGQSVGETEGAGESSRLVKGDYDIKHHTKETEPSSRPHGSVPRA